MGKKKKGRGRGAEAPTASESEGAAAQEPSVPEQQPGPSVPVVQQQPPPLDRGDPGAAMPGATSEVSRSKKKKGRGKSAVAEEQEAAASEPSVPVVQQQPPPLDRGDPEASVPEATSEVSRSQKKKGRRKSAVAEEQEAAASKPSEPEPAAKPQPELQQQRPAVVMPGAGVGGAIPKQREGQPIVPQQQVVTVRPEERGAAGPMPQPPAGRGRGRGRGRGQSFEQKQATPSRETTPVIQEMPAPSPVEALKLPREEKMRPISVLPTEPEQLPKKLEPQVPLTFGPIDVSKQLKEQTPEMEAPKQTPKVEAPKQMPTPAPQAKQKGKPKPTEISLKEMEKALPPIVDRGLKPPARIDYGKLGRPIRLRANHFPVKFNSKIKINHYDIDIKPDLKGNKTKKRLIVNQMTRDFVKVFGNYTCVFDGQKNMYSTRNFNFPPDGKHFEVNLPEGDRTQKFTVVVKFAASVSLTELEGFLNGRQELNPTAIQALDVAMRHLGSSSHLTIGQSIFPDSKHGYDLGGGIEMWKGYYQSLRPQWKELRLNLDVSNRTFHTAKPVLNFLCDLFGIRNPDAELRNIRFDNRNRETFRTAIKGLKVEITHTSIKRTYRIASISEKSAELQLFPLEENGTTRDTSVARYFLEKHNVRLKYPFLPCLQAQPLEKHRYLPIEVCTIPPGQQTTGTLADFQTANMIKATAQPPAERKIQIERMMKEAGFQKDKYLQEFGLSVSDSMMAVNGRVLPPPTITLNNNFKVDPWQGVWDMRNRQFLQGVTIDEWGIVLFDRMYPDRIRAFVDSMITTGQSLGVRCRQPLFTENGQPGHVEKMFKAIKESHPHIRLLIVILPGKTPVYAEVKRVGDNMIGVATQCVQKRNAEKCSPQTITNIFMKINAKLGGTNSVLVQKEISSVVFKTAVIILGADVTHPPAGDTTKPSIAAVIGSLDKNAVKYKAKICVQEHRKEIIVDLKNKVIELLKDFRAATNVAPKRIIFYRDGVGEGQFLQVLQHELMAIRQACQALDPNYKPGITFLVVQKRHHTRLFCEDKKDQVGRSGNVPPGTTVDTQIVHPIENDFYLCSHQGIQGTSRPTHYHVLWDDSNFTSDILQQLTYELCHTYVRCTRSVSIPSPAYYAHLAAFRARHHLSDLQDRFKREGGDPAKWLNLMQNAVETHRELGSMYFA